MKCPSCGAAVKDGKFCNYCGAKLPDDTKRVEININKKIEIEDKAEIKRAEYETEESKIRRKQMKQELRKGRFNRILLWGTVGGFGLSILSRAVGLDSVANILLVIGSICLVCGVVKVLTSA